MHVFDPSFRRKPESPGTVPKRMGIPAFAGMTMRLLVIVCLLLVVPSLACATPSHGINPFGVLKYPANFKHFEYVNPTAPKGGRIKLETTVTFDSLNPFILKGVAAPGMLEFYESLMTSALDEPQSYYGLIASSIDLSPDRSHADFTLRKEARWHDGVPITAEDVVFSFHALKKKGHPSFRILYQPIEKVEALDAYHVRFTFADATVRELPLLAASMPILPKHYYDDEHPFDKTSLIPPLGSGPYKVKSVDQGRSITYERVPDYWGKDLAVNVGQHNFDELHYDVYRDETVAVEAIKSGQYDFREEYIARNWATAFDTPAVRDGRLIKVKVPNKIPRGMQAFLFNLREDKFSDRRVREAIGLAMDYEWMNNTLFYGAYDRTQSFFQSTDFMAAGLPSKEELKLLEPFRKDLPPELFTTEFKVPKTDASGYPRDNLLKAQGLLDAAGWSLKDGLRVNAKGEPLTVEFMMRQRTFERVVGSMIRNLKKLGITATFRYVDDSQYQKRIDDRDFDVISIWWNLGVFFPGNEQISYWHSSQSEVVGGNNFSGMKRPVVDALLAKLTQAQTLEELTPAARALDRVLLWDHVVIPHWYLGAWRLLYWDKFGRPDITPVYGVGLDSWWSKEAK